MDNEDKLNELTHRIIGILIRVHRVLGPGLLESIYRRCVAYELRQAGSKVDEERPIPLVYGDMQFDCAYRVDMVVNDQVLLEIKSVERLEPVHGSQILTYLRLTNCRIGLLVNFNTSLLKNGLKRFVHSPAGDSDLESPSSALEGSAPIAGQQSSARPLSIRGSV